MITGEKGKNATVLCYSGIDCFSVANSMREDGSIVLLKTSFLILAFCLYLLLVGLVIEGNKHDKR